MKQNITAAVILTLIIIGSFVSVKYTEKVSQNLTYMLNACEDSVLSESWESASHNISQCSKLWDKYKPALSALLTHRELSEISDLIINLTSLVTLRDKTAYITENKRLAALVKKISLQDIITFENLF